MPARCQTLSSCSKQVTCLVQPLKLCFSDALAAIFREGGPLACRSSADQCGPGVTTSSGSANTFPNTACNSACPQEASCSHQASGFSSEGAPAALKGMQSGQGMEATLQPSPAVPYPLGCSQSQSLHSGLPLAPCRLAMPSCGALHAHPSSPSLSYKYERQICGSWQLHQHWWHQPLAPSLPHWPHAEAHARTPGQTRLFGAIAPAAMSSPGHARQPVRQAATAELSVKALAQQGQIDKAVALLRSKVAGHAAVAATQDLQTVIAALCQAGQAQVGLHCSYLLGCILSIQQLYAIMHATQAVCVGLPRALLASRPFLVKVSKSVFGQGIMSEASIGEHLRVASEMVHSVCGIAKLYWAVQGKSEVCFVNT